MLKRALSDVTAVAFYAAANACRLAANTMANRGDVVQAPVAEGKSELNDHTVTGVTDASLQWPRSTAGKVSLALTKLSACTDS